MGEPTIDDVLKSHAELRAALMVAGTRPALIEWAKDRGLCKPKWLKPTPVVRNRKMRGFFGLVYRKIS
jgi:hypothetical protein